MSSGVFAVARNVFSHDFFAAEPFTEREAWIWLIGEAAWKERRVRVGDYMISLARGQCAFSVRFLADKWGWSKSRVGRFLDRLKTEAMIGTDAGQGVSVITICKYKEYQKVSLPSETSSGTPIGTDAGHMRDKEENRENIQSIIKEEPLRGPSAGSVKNPEAEVYRLGKELLGKSAGGVLTNLRKACDYDDSHALEWLKQAADKQNPMEWVQAVLKASKDREYRGVDGAPHYDVPAIESREARAWKAEEARIYKGVH